MFDIFKFCRVTVYSVLTELHTPGEVSVWHALHSFVPVMVVKGMGNLGHRFPAELKLYYFGAQELKGSH
jgi:hypothetical protein